MERLPFSVYDFFGYLAAGALLLAALRVSVMVICATKSTPARGDCQRRHGRQYGQHGDRSLLRASETVLALADEVEAVSDGVYVTQTRGS